MKQQEVADLKIYIDIMNTFLSRNTSWITITLEIGYYNRESNFAIFIISSFLNLAR